MAPTPRLQDLVAAVDAQDPGGDADAHLGAAVRMAGDLRTLGDELVDHYVHAARAAGRSWTDIGDVLGISRQGAQQRFASPATRRVEPWPRGFGPDAQAVFADAVDEARNL